MTHNQSPEPTAVGAGRSAIAVQLSTLGHLRTMKRTFAITAVLLITALLMSSCSNSPDIMPPVTGSDGIESTLLHSYMSEPSGMTGDQDIYMVWHLQATPEQIEHATSDAQVHDGLEWHKGLSERLQEALKFLTYDEKYNSFQPFISDIVKDPNVRYAFREFSIFPDGKIASVAVWICSPQTNQIAYLQDN